MGSFQVVFQIGDRQGRNWRDISALVDTGARYTWIPRSVLEELAVEPETRREFQIANGDVIERDLAETRLRYDGQEVTTIVVFGDLGSTPLLGAYSLEGLALGPDPLNQILIPVRPYAM